MLTDNLSMHVDSVQTPCVRRCLLKFGNIPVAFSEFLIFSYTVLKYVSYFDVDFDASMELPIFKVIRMK